MKRTEICLEGIDNGAVLAKANKSLRQAVDDVCDLNKPVKEKREIVIKIILTPNEDRERINIKGAVSTKFPGMRMSEDFADLDFAEKKATIITERPVTADLPFDNIQEL